jgi:hypothetical protein
MSDVMVDQQQFEDQAAPATARGHSKQSVNSATSLPTAGRARLQPRNTDIQSFADVRPVIQGWLRNYDQVFMPLEEKTGIPREMVSSGVFGFIDPQIILFFYRCSTLPALSSPCTSFLVRLPGFSATSLASHTRPTDQ